MVYSVMQQDDRSCSLAIASYPYEQYPYYSNTAELERTFDILLIVHVSSFVSLGARMRCVRRAVGAPKTCTAALFLASRPLLGFARA